MTSLHTGAASLVGQVRTSNEDSFLVTDDLVAVADGMGGHRAGEVASATTVDVLRSASGARAVEDLVAGVHRANRRINERAAEDDELRGMGTTVCVVGHVRYDGEDQLAVLNVGDSRVYLRADDELTRLTEDHSLVETLVREGRISAEEAEHHPQRNVITRALGVEALVVVDAWLLRPCDGDRLLLCSDGLFGELSEERIGEILADGDDPEVVARRLAAEADAAGGRDNVTTVVVDVSDTGRDPAPVEGRYRRISTPAVDMSDPEEDGPRTETVMAVVVAPPTRDDDGDPEVDDGAAEDGADDHGPDDHGPDDHGPDDHGPDDHDDDDHGPDDHDDDRIDDDLDVDGVAGRVPTTGDGDGGGREADPDARTVSESTTESDHDRVEAAEDADGDLGDDLDDDEPKEPRGRMRMWRTALFVVAVAALIAAMAAVLLVWSRSGWVVAERDGVVVLLRGPNDGVLFIGPSVEHRYGDLVVSTLNDETRLAVERGRSFDTRAEARGYVERIREATTTTTPPSTTVPGSTAPESTTVPDTIAPTETTVSGAPAPGAVPPASVAPSGP